MPSFSMILLQATQRTLLRTSSGVTGRKCHNIPYSLNHSPCDYQIFKTEAIRGNSFQTPRTFNSSLVWGSNVRWCQWCLSPSVSLAMISRQPQGPLWMLLTVLTCSPCCTVSCSLSIRQITTMKLYSKYVFCLLPTSESGKYTAIQW